MMEYMIFPHMGDWIEEGKIVRWLKHEGDPVKQGDPLVEVETNKVNIEIEAPCSGVVYGILVGEGEAVSVGTVLACIGKPDESFPAPNPPFRMPPASKQPALLRWLRARRR
jgi:pyruvate/2-oxoglutarate dehydrogenase complex dihydrolipoamide acyltransferase (E2) component